MLEKTHYLLTVEGRILGPGVEVACWRDSTDNRQMFPHRILENGRLALAGPSVHDGWQQIEARFVYEDNRAVFLFSFFFNSGQRSVRHCSMATSFRCLARFTGFWRLQPILCNSLPTYCGV